MDAFNDDFKVSSKGKRKSYDVSHDSLSLTAVERLMQQDVDHIGGIFGVDVSFVSLKAIDCFLTATNYVDKHRFLAPTIYGLEQGTSNRKVHGQRILHLYQGRHLST